jgi:MoaA/NifB/PqqE/SkfB family radical SAM enzyme
MDIDLSYIDKFLENVSGIGNITFTGGEPSLNVDAIEYTLRLCQEKGIRVNSFYIVTNGLSNTLPLAIACLKWYAYCDNDDELCGIALSKDMFHDYIPIENEMLLRGLSFFRDDKFTDFNLVSIINEGRAEELSDFRKVNAEDRREDFSVFFDGDIVAVESMIYLSANGDIKTDCDIAYENDECTIGNLNADSLHYIIQLQLHESMELLPF